jgi:hypothetical protein
MTKTIALLLALISTGCAAQLSGNGSVKGGGRWHKGPPPSALVINDTTPLSPAATQGVAFGRTLSASGGTSCGSPPYRWTVVAGTLSPFTLEFYGGRITGTDSTAETKTFTVRVTDCGGVHTDKAFTLVVNAATGPTITDSSPLPSGTVGVNDTFQFHETGGTGPFTWTNPGAGLPPGCTLNSSGLLSCSPPTTSGTYSGFHIHVTDALANFDDQLFTKAVACPAISISSTPSWPNATVNIAYSFQLTSTGGTGTLLWAVTGLPTGLTVNTGTGLVSGTPTVSGSFSPASSVTDSCLPTGSTATQNDSLTVAPGTGPVLETTPSPLPTGTVGVLYTQSMACTGGTPPYTFSTTAGAFPTGLSMNSAGLITGTPTTAQTTTPSIRCTDAVAAHDDGASPYSITINSAASSSDDSRYCNSAELWTGGTTDGVATLPLTCVYTPLSATPSPGPTKTVCAVGCDFTTLQLAVNAATCGEIIQIKSTSDGSPTGTQLSYSGLTQIPAKSCDNAHWIRVTTDQFSGLPAEGSRITPGWAGVASIPGRPAYAQPATPGAYLPKLINNNTVIKCTAGASHWRFIGLELTTTTGIAVTDTAQCPGADHFIWDRVLPHGGNSPTWQSHDDVKRFLDAPQNTYLAVINSYCADYHTQSPGSDCFLLGGTSATTEGPWKIVNNFVEAADSSSGIGGGGVGASTVVPGDLEWRRNHQFKPLFWKSNDPTFFGTTFVAKNAIDWKNVQRVLIEGNVIERAWGQQSDQFGALLLLGAKNQSFKLSGSATSVNATATVTATVGTFPSNMTSASCAIPGHCFLFYGGTTYQVQTEPDTKHVTVLPAPPNNATALSFTGCGPGLNPNATVTNITIRYNYFSHASRGIEVYTSPSDCVDIGRFTQHVEVHDNVMDDIDPAVWNLSSGACCGYGIPAFVTNGFASPNNLDFITFEHNTFLSRLSSGPVGSGPDLGIGAQSSATGWVGHLKYANNISAAGLGLAAKGVCASSPQSALVNLQCWDKISGVAQNTFCFDHNGLATTTATSGAVTGTANNPPYPAAGQSLGCGFTTTGNTLIGSYDLILFTNLNGANGGDYTLQLTSPFHNAASDGTDLGANVGAVTSYTQGVN